jgi:hypothetical protein
MSQDPARAERIRHLWRQNRMAVWPTLMERGRVKVIDRLDAERDALPPPTAPGEALAADEVMAAVTFELCRRPRDAGGRVMTIEAEGTVVEVRHAS